MLRIAKLLLDYAAEEGKQFRRFAEPARQMLLNYPWQGISASYRI